ncbi:hypothetical protein [Candidatus Enterococcus murrayae]|uniref:Uncharacterized protein n=1 Tax=Candidatus Enterococcus murrayae TaxID=2815321 RepID=A0ABS3HDM7_9ENTE|nr:hypothetical protein [Enterococcus sp. MJM16]MBO0451546.1 hypothetical protein [Enterococcus sp. MJM16]
MKKRKIQVPFYCVNSQVLWKDEEAVKNAVLVDKKVSQLGMDAIFTVSSEDVSKVKKAVNRVKLAIDFENAKPDNLERLKAEGAEIIIFDDLESIFNIKNILEIVKELDYSVLVRTAKPFEIPENVLNYLDIIKWKFGEDTAELLSDTQLTAKQNTFLKKFKSEYPDIAIIYGTKQNISSNLVLNTLLIGMDGFGEINGYRTTTEKRAEMLNAMNDYKNVLDFIR